MQRRFSALIVSAALLLAGCGAAPQVRSAPTPPPAVAAPAPSPMTADAPQPGKVTVATTDPGHSTTPAVATTKPEEKTPPAVAHATDGTTPEEKHPRQPRLAILVYHDVDDHTSNAYTISSALLDAHVKMLVEEGYKFYRLSDVEKLLAGGEGLPEKGVMLAFDDGYTSFYDHVWPIAKKYNVPAVCFVVTKYLDQIVIDSRPHMSNAQIRELAASNLMELAGHSHDGHREATTASGASGPVLINRIQKANGQVESEQEYRDRVRADFAANALRLTQHGVTSGVRHFTFPNTARSEEAVKLGQEAGFMYFYIGGEQLVTPNSDPTAIPRVTAGAPEISAEVLKYRLRNLFDQPE